MKITLQIFWLFLLMGLTACHSSSEVEFTSDTQIELLDIRNRLQSMQPDSPWQAIDLISGIDTNTLRFISANPRVDLLSSELKEKISALQSMGVNLQSGAVVLENPSVPAKYEVDASSEVWLPSIQSEYEKIKQSNEIYAYEFMGGRQREAHYCRNQCACLSQHFVEELNHSVQIQVRGYGGLNIKNHLGNKVWFGYHVATAVRLQSAHWGIIDPIMYGDANPRSIQDWQSRIVDTEKLKIYLFPR